ncbi:MAG TPA: EamA family transporter [Candidatus Thermoplasmatota archaeon]|nr:EamA family transporter [Candidatus Thermoplasmatota archaeon]
MKPSPASLKVLAFVACVVIWGSTWRAIRVGYEPGTDAFFLAAIRFFMAAALLVLVAFALRVPIPTSGRPLALCVFVGVTLFGLDYGLIYWGEQYIPSGTTAVLFAIMPLSTAVLAHFFLPSDRITWRKLAGIAIGVSGMVVLFWDSLSLGEAVLPMLAIVASTVFAAAASVATKKWGQEVHPASLNAVAMAVGAVLLTLGAFLHSGVPRFPETPVAWGAILYLAVAGSVVTFLLYFWLLKSWPATRMSFVALLTPLIALAIAVAYQEESLNPRFGAGAALILAGVFLASWTPATSRKPVKA